MGNSIIDGLKSRLMQYLKHMVEDDVLFTKRTRYSNSSWGGELGLKGHSDWGVIQIQGSYLGLEIF